MKLRSQMLLAGALTLVVPLVGWQSVKQLYVALQQTRIDEQVVKVATMRLALSESPALLSWLTPALAEQRRNDWYAEVSPYPLFVDGYDDDWRNLLGSSHVYQSEETENRFELRLARRDQRLFLFLQVTDEQLIYHKIPELRADLGENEQPDLWYQLVNGDSVHISVQSPEGRVSGLFRTVSPGSVLAVSDTVKQTRLIGDVLQGWQGFWSRSADGYQLEVSMPLPDNGASIGIAVVDVDQVNEPRSQWLGTFNPLPDTRDDSVARVFYASDKVTEQLQGWTNEGVRTRLFDANGRLIADVNKLYTTSRDDLDDEQAASFSGVLDALLFRVFSLMVADDLPLLPVRRNSSVALNLSAVRRQTVSHNEPLTSRYVTDENDRVLGTLSSMGRDTQRAYLLLEANEEHASAYAGSQLARLFSLLLLVSLMAGCGLLVFALVLSSRIRRLSHDAQQAIGMDGRVGEITVSEAQDEIGDLSRNLSSLLSRSAQYTQYLEALSGRLSHELQTPLSVVRTSLENLEVDVLDEQSKVLVKRAEKGAVQLGHIIKALVDSTRLEHSVQSTATQTIDLSHWLCASAELYAQLYSNIRFVLRPESLPPCVVNISPELLQQAMDKLVDNAVSFSTDEKIVLQLTLDTKRAQSRVMLAVANRGPAIDENQWPTLFDPLVSIRELSGKGISEDKLHLGLGLHMVRLITKGAGGEVFARNQNGWVVFGVSLPLA